MNRSTAPSADRAGRSFWNEHWAGLPAFSPYQGPVFEVHSVIAPFLRGAAGRTAIEIGCVPGNFLVYLSKEFGYRVSGIDYSDRLDYARANLEYHDVPVGRLHLADVFSFDSSDRFDLVFSSGFVEHFADHALVIQKHADMAKAGGSVVVIVPNLTHIHRLLCSTFQRRIFETHVLTLMDPANLRDALTAAGLEVLHCDFQTTFRPVYPLPMPISLMSRALQKALRMAHMDNIGNRFGSPYLISVSKKP